MQVVVNGLMTRYEKAGEGPIVVCLHGWGDKLDSFAGITRELKDVHQVITLDLPGFGGTQAPPEAWGLSNYADFIRAFLKKIDVAKIHGLIGHSNGGAIAIKFLASDSIDTDKLVLLASAGIRSTYKGRKKVLRLVAKSGKVITYPLPSSLKSKLRKSAYKSIGSDMFVAEHMQETFKKIVTDDIQDDAAKLKLPTLLIYGEKDDMTPSVYGELLHNLIDGSILEIIADADHFLLGNNTEYVAEQIKAFLK